MHNALQANIITVISLGKSLQLGYHATAEERNMKQAACIKLYV